MEREEIYDKEKIEADNLMEPIYRHDQNGNYSLGIGYDYLPKDDLMCHEFWKITNEKLGRIRQEVRDGKSTPLLFFMEKYFLDPFAFSKFLGISVLRLKRHMKPSVYARLKPHVIQKYADALEITLDEFIAMKGFDA